MKKTDPKPMAGNKQRPAPGTINSSFGSAATFSYTDQALARQTLPIQTDRIPCPNVRLLPAIEQ